MKKNFFIITLSLFICHFSQAQQGLSDLTFGPQKESSGKSLDDIVAIAGNDIITRREINRFPKKNRPMALQSMIMQKLLLQTAKRYNINVGDTAVNLAYKNQRRGKVSRQALRDKLIIEKLQQQVAAQLVQISDMEIEDIVSQQLSQSVEQIQLVDVLVRVPKSSDPEVLNQAQAVMREVMQKLKSQSGSQVAAQYKNVHYNDLGWVELAKIPPSFSKVLVDVPLNQYSKPIVDRDGIHILKVLNRKQQGKASASIPETKVAHILIRDKDNPEAQKTINQLYQQIRKGADFFAMASQYSEDPGSAANGGNLGWVRSGQMVPTFEKVMRQTGEGKTSKPFKSRYGYHILKVEKRRKTAVSSRELLEAEARKTIFQRKAAEEWDMWLARLRAESHVEIRDNNL